ncbi:FKBP-type peptidyl-prolyl cis-trans isomerase [Mycolicibacterium stellerae]|uniref:FKBP-type peptidyl-prolyl cis-trans isomerase n=1 Tax=Mycolicibacterium stellerae TaxID=2358193 RepID=UPI0019D27254|nr:FKBP-type peptidyl-prolyl cis-trans isomerase [Mycolicibacterium stellerae]
MNVSRTSPIALVASAASLVIMLAACGSDADTSSATTSSALEASTSPVTQPLASSAVPEAPIAASTCPTAAPANGGTPEWTLPGATGSVAVTGSTDTTAPRVDVQAPFSVTETQVQTLKAGEGPVVADTATVSVCYMGVNGRDGTVFDSAYERGAPADFPLTGVVPGFQKAIAGQKVGSTVAVAMTSADGYPDGQPAAGIQQGDTLVFALKILDASS